MFKAARWRSEKSKTKVVFQLRFHATQVQPTGREAVTVTVIPADAGRPTARSERVPVVEGACDWVNPVFEVAKLVRNPKTGKMDEKVYRFVVSDAGSSKTKILGEASINLADYTDVFRPSSVVLPLKGSNTGASLRITIQRLQDDDEGREGNDIEESTMKRHRRTLESQLSKCDDEDGSEINNQAAVRFSSSRGIPLHNADSNGNLQKSHTFDAVSASGSDTGSGIYTPRENGIVLLPLTNNGTSKMRMFSSDASTRSSSDDGLHEISHDSEDSFEKLKSNIDILTRKLEVSDLELQTLRKQIIKENKRGQDISKEMSDLQEERDALKRECDELKILEKRRKFDTTTSLQHDRDNHLSLLEEIQQELDHEKNRNVHLLLQLKLTQEANSELVLAVKDLEGMLEQRHNETLCDNCSKMEMKDTVNLDLKATKFGNGSSHLHKSECKQQIPKTISVSDNEEEYALVALINERDDMKTAYSLENKIIDLNNEAEFYRKNCEELEMQMEQLSLDYEILKQENHDATTKLEQMQLHEQLRMQYECSAHFSIISDLELQVELLEKELQKQTGVIEADLATITLAKVEQEKRAIVAEETLRNTKWNISKSVECFQEELRSLSAFMSSTFQANEKTVMQALKENAKLQSQKGNLERILEKSNKDMVLLQEKYRVKLKQLVGLIGIKSRDVEMLILKLKDKSKELDNHKLSEEALQKNFIRELQLLKSEVATLQDEKSFLLEQNGEKEKLLVEMELLRKKFIESEISLQNRNLEIDFLKKEIETLREKVCKSLVNINDLRHTKDGDAILDTMKSKAPNQILKQNLLKHDSNGLLEEKQMITDLVEQSECNKTTSTNDSNNFHQIPRFTRNNVQCHLEYQQQPEEDKGCVHNKNVTDKESQRRFAESNLDEDKSVFVSSACDQKVMEKVLSEMALLKEQNELMVSELKEMQERYSNISLKFAEVESERQQLLMTIRSLKNATKN
ncbi:intracellular protein transport protein USO1-like [Zingiber officinale]|uniref:intracellular protein transport protein USO1-like n=1 Tax=Zingiber officinale TaxID=94328 RepID=UPI001C4D9699|nr:intracellular protein transport protein USO1-like [Zingiber officinale]XP_042406863.1 intracellular protein transport protein USO1-like [Zingiber officinale]